MKYLKLYENFYTLENADLKKELNKYNITNYVVNIDGTIDVDDDVNLSNKNLNRIPFRFGKVTGNFYCGSNPNLKSLEGCPLEVYGNFDCTKNNLDNLIGGPEEVGKNYICMKCGLKSLDGIASEIGSSLDCGGNELIDLNISSIIGSYLVANANKINPNNYNFYGEVGKKIIL